MEAGRENALQGVSDTKLPRNVEKPSLRNRHRQQGAFAVMFAAVVLVMLGVCGLAVDLSMVYNRKIELNRLSKTVALAAARELDGTASGITRATDAAREAASLMKYQYGLDVNWVDSAITFSTTPNTDAEWMAAGAAAARPGPVFFVKVDTNALGKEVGTVKALIMPLLGAQQSVELRDTAVAGRSTINVVPFGICAMSALPGEARANSSGVDELVQYGFRRGVAYDLMQLNPNGTTPANFVIDPVSPPGGLGNASNTSASTVAPFICTGRMWIPRVTGGAIRVSSPFPIGSLYKELNSRFDDFDQSSCDPNGAPPDYNIKAYDYSATNGIAWMNPKPTSHSAVPRTSGQRLQTIADFATAPSGTAAEMYGPLWSYARAVKYLDYREGVPERSTGYSRFATSDWGSLYPPGPGSVSYPSSTPYFAMSGNNYKSPRSSHIKISEQNRRVLHVPLLSCPISPGTNVGATALAIGKFFMTMPATETSIHAEFAGIAHESTIVGQVILYP